MSDRLCGYCRQPGHMVSKCEVKSGQIQTIRTHIGNQRKIAQKILLANGIGVGAIVTAHDSWTGNEIPCIVHSIKTYDNLIDYRILKYSKKVRATLGTYGAALPEPQYDGLVQYQGRGKITLEVFTLADMSKSMLAYFPLSSLEKPLVTPITYHYSWEYSPKSNILSPADDQSYDEEAIMEPFTLHERLGVKTGSNRVKPRVTF